MAGAETGGSIFVVWNMVWNAGIVGIAAYFIRKWITSQDQKFDNAHTDIIALRTEAESRSVRLHERLDEMTACLTTVKVDIEGKVDREDCDEIGRQINKTILQHEHVCCASKDGRVIPK